MTNRCLLGGCGEPAPTFTLCDFHREEHGISVLRDPERRRKERHRQAREEQARAEEQRQQAEEEARRRAKEALLAAQKKATTGPPKHGVHRFDVPITVDMILALQDALENRTSRQLRDEIGVSHDTVQRLSQATPGQRVTARTHTKITEWMNAQ